MRRTTPFRPAFALSVALLAGSASVAMAAPGSAQPLAPVVEDEDAVRPEPIVTAEKPHYVPHPTHHQHAEEHHRFHFGASGVALTALGSGEPQPSYGGEVFFEVIVEPHWLEIELNIGGMAAEDGFLLAIDLVYKKPFVVTKWLHPFIGLGPTFIPAFLPTETGFAYGIGGTLVAGTHLWLASSFGIVIEAKYNLLYQKRDLSSGVAQEVGGGAGLIVAL